jgi:hypothetical protein
MFIVRSRRQEKGIQVICDVNELDSIMETMSPRGMLLSMSRVIDRKMGERVINKLESWTSNWLKGQ